MLLMIDNYDSFTFNLVQYFGELGEDVRVVRNDEITSPASRRCSRSSWCSRPAPARRPRRASASRPSATSPASCRSWACAWATRPSARRWAGASCARRCRCTARPARSRTDGRGVYRGLPERFSVIRYHSLVIERETLPAELESRRLPTTARSWACATGLAARATPLEGVQFHPESILSEHGHAMLKNFLQMGAPR
jgi:anthranilate synthase component II